MLKIVFLVFMCPGTFVLIYPCRCRWIRSLAVLFPSRAVSVFVAFLFFISAEFYPKISIESVGWPVLFLFSL